MAEEAEMETDFTGLWISADHDVRKMLLPNGRFIALVGAEARRYQGEYRIEGQRIVYRKDNGMIGEGEFIDGVLYQAGLALFAEGYDEVEAA
jgi:hypothetical protein